VDWLGFFVPRLDWRRSSVESLSPPDPDDLDRLDELRELGSKLKLPHPVRAFLAFPEEPAARAAADLLARDGFGCAVRVEQDGSWVVTAVTRLVPTPGAITRLREQARSVTDLQGGTYRGWDAPVIY
jgi:hypothetical protein